MDTGTIDQHRNKKNVLVYALREDVVHMTDQSLPRHLTDAELMRQGADVLAAERHSRALWSALALLLGAVIAAVGATLLWGVGAGLLLFGILGFITGVLTGLDS